MYKKRFVYFISYNHISRNSNGSGMCEVACDKKINNINDLNTIKDLILRNEPSLTGLIIVNYKLLRVKWVKRNV